MVMRIFVGYASEHRSTEEIARRIAARLEARGVATNVDVAPLDRARSAIRYDAVVLGSAIHDGKWLPAARNYVLENARALASRPLWMFSVGMVAALPRRLQPWASREGTTAVAALPGGLDPRSTRLFSGVVEKEHLPALGRALFAVFGARYGDFRDWKAIDAWADEIADDLATWRPGRWEPDDMETEAVGVA